MNPFWPKFTDLVKFRFGIVTLYGFKIPKYKVIVHNTMKYSCLLFLGGNFTKFVDENLFEKFTAEKKLRKIDPWSFIRECGHTAAWPSTPPNARQNLEQGVS
jgi:hypothetical protein